jgi:tripartite-type tricarboxylate transporter receptor subunit TctC
MNSRRHALQALAALTLAASAGAWAQAWPSKPLKIVVPNAAGGTSDIIARLISKPLSDALGVPVIVENRGGAGGNIGAAAVAQATDQHTILLCDVGGLAIAPLAYKNLPYDPARDLQGVAMLAYAPYLLVVPSTLKASNLKELVALSKAERLSAAVPGTGTPNHLATMQLAQLTGLRLQ